MRRLIDDVKRFQLMANDPIRDTPTCPIPLKEETLCSELIREEHRELQNAIVRDDLPEIADGIVDLMYVLVFAGTTYGLPLESLWDAVQRANMTKAGPDGVIRKREDGKVLKPHGFTPPDIRGVLINHGWHAPA